MENPTEHAIEVYGQELHARIAWIIRLRWLAAAGVGATVWLVPRAFGIHLEEERLYFATLSLAIYNAGLWTSWRWLPQVGRGFGQFVFANVQISVDLLFLTALLHYGGGSENPFVCYYVFHTVLASILLSRRATYVQVGLALLLFLGMVLGEASGLLPHYHLHGYLETELYREVNYLTAVTVVIVTMLGFTAFMATTIMGRLREREAEIVRLSVSLGERASELQRAYDALRALERDKSEYMKRAAHDLRSPMSAVDLLLAVVEEGRAGDIAEKSKEMLARARRKIAQVLDLASDLLTLSRAREAAFEVNLRPVDIGEILRKLEEDFRPRAESNSIALTIEAEENSAMVLGDAGALSEMLENLISNALKYTPAGGTVRVTLAQEQGEAVITVADSGIGIAAEEVAHIFDEFFRAKNARESGKEGTGLGLSIVKAIVTSHKGKIKVTSEPGKGTTFQIAFPNFRAELDTKAER